MIKPLLHKHISARELKRRNDKLAVAANSAATIGQSLARQLDLARGVIGDNQQAAREALKSWKPWVWKRALERIRG